MAPPKVQELIIRTREEGSGVFERVAARARALRKENALSGENALGRYANGGIAGGISQFAIDSLNIGVPTMLLELAGKSLNDMTAKAIELRKEYEAGNKTIGEMANELAGTLPIYGQIWQAGRNIHELITGEKIATAALNEEIKRTNEIYSAQATVAKIVAQAREDAQARIARINNQADTVGKDPFTQRRMNSEQQTKDDIKAVKDRLKSEQEELRKAAQPGLDALQKEVELAQKAAEKARAPLDDNLKNSEQVRKYGVSASALMAPDELKAAQKAYNELFAAQQNAQQRYAEAKAKLDGEQKEKETSANKEETALKNRDNETKRQAEKERQDAITKLIREGKEQQADIEAKAAADRLRALGLDADAEILLIKANAEKVKKANEVAYQDNMKKTGLTREDEQGDNLWWQLKDANASIDKTAQADIERVRAEQADKRFKIDMDRERQSAERRADLRSEIRQHELRDAGQYLQEDIESIRRKYDKMRDATSDGEELLQIDQRQKQEEHDARRKDLGRNISRNGNGIDANPISNDFRDIATVFRAQEDPMVRYTEEVAKNTKVMTDIADNTLKTLELMNQKLDKLGIEGIPVNS